jgi:hypothetical protein
VFYLHSPHTPVRCDDWEGDNKILPKTKEIIPHIQIYFSPNAVSVFKNPNKCDRHSRK